MAISPRVLPDVSRRTFVKGAATTAAAAGLFGTSTWLAPENAEAVKRAFCMGGAVFKDRTKRLFAAELESMLAEMPLSKVRVNALCERCGVQRQAFYYHFKDKYDLVAWIFEQDFRAGADEAGCTGYREQTAAVREGWER